MMQRSLLESDEQWSATFSECGKYRYSLGRIWDSARSSLNFIMLNPSTATEYKNDATIERCYRRAKSMGFGSLWVTNIFAYRATDPKDMRAAEDPIGPLNDEYICNTAFGVDMVICGWGSAHGSFMGRGAAVEEMLRHITGNLHALKICNDGSPSHPLYISYKKAPEVWQPR